MEWFTVKILKEINKHSLKDIFQLSIIKIIIRNYGFLMISEGIAQVN